MRHLAELTLIDQIVACVFAGWVLIGVCLAIVIMCKDGMPDYETYDGPKIDWRETFSLIVLCIAGGPLWIALYYWLRKPA